MAETPELASMKNPPRKPSKEEKMYPTMAVEPDEYPYGLRVSLDDPQLDALGLSDLPKGGTEVTMHAKGHVVSRTEHEGDDGKTRKSLGIQITHLHVE